MKRALGIHAVLTGGDHVTAAGRLVLTATKPKRLPAPRGGWAAGEPLASVTLDVCLVSEANQREHWRTRHLRKKAQQAAVRARLAVLQPPEPPVHVTLTRRAPGQLDEDNLASSAKHVQDEIARWLQVDDGDRGRVAWKYKQEPAARGVYQLHIRIARAVPREGT